MACFYFMSEACVRRHVGVVGVMVGEYGVCMCECVCEAVLSRQDWDGSVDGDGLRSEMIINLGSEG